jgi:hypothetical protein
VREKVGRVSTERDRASRAVTKGAAQQVLKRGLVLSAHLSFPLAKQKKQGTPCTRTRRPRTLLHERSRRARHVEWTGAG